MPSVHHTGGKWIRPTSRLAILLRDDITCVWCERPMHRMKARDVTLDHVVPREHGGSNDASNLVAACKTCNSERGTMTPRDFALRMACTARGVAYDAQCIYATDAVCLTIAADVKATLMRVRNARQRLPNRSLARAIIRGEIKDPRPAVQAKRTRKARRAMQGA